MIYHPYRYTYTHKCKTSCNLLGLSNKVPVLLLIFVSFFILSSSEFPNRAYGSCQHSSGMINKVARARNVCSEEVMHEFIWPCLADSYPGQGVPHCERLPKVQKMKSGVFSVNTIWFHFQIFVQPRKRLWRSIYPHGGCELLFMIENRSMLHSLAHVLVCPFSSCQILNVTLCHVDLCITYCHCYDLEIINDLKNVNAGERGKNLFSGWI